MRKDQKETSNDTPLEADDVRQLIAMFSKYENLYNPKNSQYGNKQIESIYYADIARSFSNKTGAQLQTYLNELRLSFEREHAIIESERRSSGKILMPTIEYYKEFLFLVPFLNLSRNGSQALTPSVSVVSIGPTEHGLNTPKDAFSYATTVYGLGHQSQQLYKNANQHFLKYAVEAQEPIKESLKAGQDEPKANQDQAQPLQEAQEPEVKSENETLPSELNPQQETNTEKLNSQTEPQAMVSCKCPQNPMNSPPVVKTGTCHCKRSCIQRAQFAPQTNVNGNYQEGNNNTNPYSVYSAPVTNTGASASKRPGQCQGACSKYAPKNNFATSQGNAQRSPANPGRARDPRGGAPNDFGGNNQQVQMLCDMIRAELSSAPDFIYYDAKWRIIEILREVNKRQMIHKKGEPAKCGFRPNGSGQNPPNAQNCPAVRDCQSNGKSCPYCPTGYRG